MPHTMAAAAARVHAARRSFVSLSRQLRKDSPAALVQDDDDWDDFSDLDHPEYSSALMSFGSGRDGQLGVSEERVEYFPSPGFVNLGDSVPTAAAAGLFHSACITECGRMWLWGKNDGGRLGTGDEIARDLPTPMELPERATNMDCGGLFTAVVTESGALFTCGLGAWGVLGHGDERRQLDPRPVEALEDIHIVDVACGGSHTLALSDTGDVYSWGNGEVGRLGLGHEWTCTVPNLVEDLPEDDPVVSIAAGGFHSSAVTASGKMYSWGGGMNGECGHGTVRNFPRPRLVEKFEEEGAHVVKASLGGYCSAAITLDGKAYMWGNNQWGRLGLGPDFTDSSVSTPMLCTSLQDAFVSDVAIGSSHGLALATPNGSKETIDGKQVAHAFSWGLGREAQLGLGDYVNTDVPTMVELEGGHGLAVAAGAHHSLVLAQMLN